jgi:hypothetical protein
MAEEGRISADVVFLELRRCPFRAQGGSRRPARGSSLLREESGLNEHQGPSALLGHRYTVAAARAQPAGSLSGMQPSASRTSPSDQT